MGDEREFNDTGDAHGHVHSERGNDSNVSDTDITGHEVGSRDTTPASDKEPAELSPERIAELEKDAQVNPHGAPTAEGPEVRQKSEGHENDAEVNSHGAQTGAPGSEAKDTTGKTKGKDSQELG